MTETAPPAAEGLSTARRRPLDPPEEVSRLRTDQPISRMTYPDGHRGWLVTDYAHARAILADPRFSAKAELKHPPVASRRIPAEAKPGDLPPGMFVHQDPPEHTRYRRLLTGQFTVRRMNQLAQRIEEIAREHAAAMRRTGPPADLVREFALPIPSLVICELLGVPYADRGRFQQDAATMLNLDTEYEDAMAALGRVFGFLGELVERKRAEPGDDLLSGLVAGGELDDPELAGVGFLLLVAGHETTANMLALGTYTLLREPAQLAALRADPGAMDNAVEELLRYLTIVHLGTQRTPLEDVELDGVLLRRGETVLLHLSTANRDPDRFDEPDRLDLARPAAGHLAFGHGVHQCLGQQLARIEMRAGFAALLEEFPGLRLAVPPEEVPMREDMVIYGVHRLPVRW
ncbi:cytochrome P450 [Amycolatopsis cihanbeyliensis]|uniref:Cytochrome P450 n=1 Tax=Amycolatopsis cihanbeyliensis TaxID=1128664 RepID=A0A542DPF5_AMYCI|nr:cytochrome P450 [Amycolatopsis cihanbeyliensis]TQJ04947.1 cytochrome P450 [Amycolatopsis cihanbeyliensis]